MLTSLLALGCVKTSPTEYSVESRTEWEILGASEDRAGEAVFNLGDLDGDGADNLGIAVETNPNGGHPVLYLLSGDESSLSEAWGRIDLGGEGQWPVSLGSCTEPFTPGHSSVVPLGDLDGDGRDELAISQPDTDHGLVHIFTGAQLAQGGSWNFNQAEIQVSGRENAWRLGLDLTTGDVDLDGDLDLVVGAPLTGNPARAGEVWVFSGRDLVKAGPGLHLAGTVGSRFQMQYDGAYLGDRVQVTSDMDGDGLPDIVALAPACDGGARAGAMLLSSGDVPDPGGFQRVNWSTDPFVQSALPAYLGLVALGDGDRDGVGEFALPGWPGVPPAEAHQSEIAVFEGPELTEVTTLQTGNNSFDQQVYWPAQDALLALDRDSLIRVETPALRSGWQKLDSLLLPCEVSVEADQHRIATGDFDGDGVEEIAIGHPKAPCSGSNEGEGWIAVLEWAPEG